MYTKPAIWCIMFDVIMCSGGPVVLSLSHANIQTAVRQRYIKSLGSDHEASLHRLIAGMLYVVSHQFNCSDTNSLIIIIVISSACMTRSA